MTVLLIIYCVFCYLVSYAGMCILYAIYPIEYKEKSVFVDDIDGYIPPAYVQKSMNVFSGFFDDCSEWTIHKSVILSPIALPIWITVGITLLLCTLLCTLIDCIYTYLFKCIPKYTTVTIRPWLIQYAKTTLNIKENNGVKNETHNKRHI